SRTALPARAQIATIFPGFMMSSGSSARLMAAMAASAGLPSSPARYFILPCPTPCSPVHVPSMASARSTSRSHNVFAALTSAASRLRGFAPRRFATANTQAGMEISAAHRPQDRPTQAGLGDLARGCGDAFRQLRNRHAHIGGQRLRAGPQPPRRPISVVPCLPQARAGLRLGRPFERTAAEIARDLAETLRLLGDARAGTM